MLASAVELKHLGIDTHTSTEYALSAFLGLLDCPGLQSLRLTANLDAADPEAGAVFAAVMAARTGPLALTSLSISSPVAVTRLDLRPTFFTLPLQSLDLRGCEMPSSEPSRFAQSLIEGLPVLAPTLQALALEAGDMTNEQYSALLDTVFALGELRHLTFRFGEDPGQSSDLNTWNARLKGLFPGLAKLESLDITDYHGGGQEDDPLDLDILATLPPTLVKLENIPVWAGSNLGALQEALARLPNLAHLSLNTWDRLPVELAAYLAGKPGFATLSVARFDQYPEDDAEQVADMAEIHRLFRDAGKRVNLQ